MAVKGIKIMIMGLVIILIGIYIGIQSLQGVRTGDREVLLIIVGAIISVIGFFVKS
ncbi:hypothetical protein [Clostridium folliculivorans]|uniref:Uncharacterized protein n=1 Tax=Clostridium folliculivorans TaxID=2886038 RepID=A0A9W5Y6K9_9CLOT|nr:hypothetical protein [Clostridium folliculivorans]GKU27327.1 hypothetical protein CFOLD11_41540 [Clostridium folliculivorans]GKU32178.1 hypothetical protein CFB3_42860 [Clostridium folliculivorans]